MSEPEIPAACEIHAGPGRLVIRREGERVVLDGHGDQCCLFTLQRAAVVALFDVVAEWR